MNVLVLSAKRFGNLMQTLVKRFKNMENEHHFIN